MSTRPDALADAPPPNAFEVRERIRWADSDPMGIIFYGAYLRLIGVAESEMFRACGIPAHELRLTRGVWIPRKALQLEFHSAAQLEEEVIVQAWFGRVGKTALTMRFEFYRASDRAHRASGALTVVSVERESMTPRPIPDDLRALLAKFAA
ncbi:MAG: acyl-CoA thioesterase [Gemmatimonadetes bacterium]|nr:acyl-CoA thioesterase [Gemmatimonadota bacterium]